MRRVLSILMIMLLMLQVPVTINAADMTIDDKASALNTLDILRGDGTGFNLEGQLSRAEAATFIVRMIGMETTVMSDKGNYLDFNYSDVASYEWYAPYVGYCNQIGVIGGFEDGSFRPLEPVSEKAFLKMLMTAMGYIYNTDFAWDTVYEKAFEIGLVLDTVYETKTQDNYDYTRGNVVGALYDTLNSKKKSSDEKMIQYFLDQGVITKDVAGQLGFEADILATEVVSIEATSANTILITFNEEMAMPTTDQVLVYNRDDNNNQVEIEALSLDGTLKVLTITLKDDMLADRDYGMLLDKLLDANGNEAEMLSGEFVGFRPDEVTSNYFMISKVGAVSANTINVYFTQPVNDNVLQPSNFTILKSGVKVAGGDKLDLTVSLMADNDHAVVLTMGNYEFDEEVAYELEVSGKAISQYGVYLLDGDGDMAKFTPTLKADEPFELLLVKADDSSTIELYFSKDLNPVLAEQVFNYYVTTEAGKAIQITDASVMSETYAVRLTVNAYLTDDTTYNIMINNVNDSSKQHYIQEEQHEFTVDYETVSDVKITNAYANDGGVVVVELSRPLDETSALKASNYQLIGKTHTSYSTVPVAVYYDKAKNPLQIKLYLSEYKDLTKSDEYTIRLLNGLIDEEGHKQSSIQSITFTAGYGGILPVTIDEAVMVGSNTVKLEFSKEISLEVPNVLNSNYHVSYIIDGKSYTKTPLSATYINETTMILSFDELLDEVEYEVYFDEMIDFAGLSTDNSTKKYKAIIE